MRKIITTKDVMNECKVGRNKALSILNEIKSFFKTSNPTMSHLDKYLGL